MEQEQFEVLVRERLGIRYLRPYQILIIRHILDNIEKERGTHLLASLPTGSGKTLCFTAPMLIMEGITVCIYPLLALISDQEKRFSAIGFNPVVLKGGMTGEERRLRIKELKDKKSKVIVTNIEMLLALIKNGEIDSIKNMIETVVIDEVHTILEWGESFRPALLEIRSVLDYLEVKNIFAFSATINSETGRKIIDLLFKGEKPYIVHSSSDRENIFYHAVRTLNTEKDMEKILSNNEMRPSVVFCSSREKTEYWADKMKKKGFKTSFYHAALDKEEKKKREDWFYSSSDGVLFATIAYGMGVSKDNIRSIIHTFVPPDASSFLQESGRGGRDGKEAHSFMLYSPNDKSPLTSVFTSTECIRRLLLERMNEEVEEKECLGCSHCRDDAFVPSGEKEILSLLSYWMILTEKQTIRALTRFSLLSKGQHLRGWGDGEIKRALSILISEKKIRRLGPFLIRGRNQSFSV